jgi:FtsX-like permease family protein
MTQDLHGLFARALDDEPLPPPDDLVRAAMHHGTALRRRRRLRIGGAAGGALVATVLALNFAAPARQSTPLPEPAALPVPAASRCVPRAAAAIFLEPDITEKQRARLRAGLESDPHVREFTYETRKQAYENFVRLWRDSPDLVRTVDATRLPEAYRVRLTAASDYRTFVAGFQARPGVDEVTPDGCLPHEGAAPAKGAR